MIWWTEARQHLPLFMWSAGLLIVARLTDLLVTSDAVSILTALISMLVWCACVFYSGSVLFAFYCLGHDLLFHISSLSRVRALFMKALILFGLLETLFLLDLAFWFDWSRLGNQIAIGDLGFVVLSRTVSLAAFVLLIAAASVTAKSAARRVPMTLIVAMAILSVVVAQAFALWSLRATQGAQWYVGITNEAQQASVYANVLPMRIVEGAGYVPAVGWLSMGLNLAASVLFLVIGLGLSRVLRANFVRV